MATPRFPRLKNLKIKTDRTVKLTLDGVDTGAGPVSLDLRFAGEANPTYWRAYLRVMEAQRAKGGGNKITQTLIDTNRDYSVKLFSEHIIAGWTNVMEEDPLTPGAIRACALTPIAAEAFLTELLENDGSDIFAVIKAYASEDDNFRDAPKLDGVELGKQ